MSRNLACTGGNAPSAFPQSVRFSPFDVGRRGGVEGAADQEGFDKEAQRRSSSAYKVGGQTMPKRLRRENS